MAIVGGMSSARLKAAKICQFLFCCNLSYFAAFHLQKQTLFSKVISQSGGERGRGEEDKLAG